MCTWLLKRTHVWSGPACWVLSWQHVNTLLVCGQAAPSSGGCSNIYFHQQSVWVTTSCILILSYWTSNVVLIWWYISLLPLGEFHMYSVHSEKWINSQQVYIKQKKKKKAEVTTTAFTHRISDLYSLMAFWVIWVFAGSSPVWTAFLSAWSLKRYDSSFELDTLFPTASYVPRPSHFSGAKWC